MWSEDPKGTKGTTQPKKEEPKRERKAEQVSENPRRWFFDFDGWGLGTSEPEFVLA